MTNPAKDDEALVDAVASCEWERGRARGIYADMAWQKFRRINEQKGGILDTLEKPLLANARAAIAAVRAHDEQRGMVLVPRVPTDEMVEAGVYELDVVSGDAGLCWEVMIEAAAKPDGDAA